MATDNEHPTTPYTIVVPDLHAVASPSRRRLGDAVEAAFLAKASSLYFAVAKPWGDDNRYDFLVDSGNAIWRIQVKCATSFDGSRYSVHAGGVSELYTANEIDFIAAYIVADNIWYVIPIEAVVPHTGFHLNPHSRRHARYEIYREAWCLLACKPKARGRKHIPIRCRCPELSVRCAVCPNRK